MESKGRRGDHGRGKKYRGDLKKEKRERERERERESGRGWDTLNERKE
jgi:hypothetical protein